MSARCVLCLLRDDLTATPVRAGGLVIGLVKARSLAELESHLCTQHTRMMAQVYAGSKAMAAKLLGVN